MTTFREELESLLNRHSMENGSNTPDFILADHLCECLRVFDHAVNHRDRWYGIAPRPGMVSPHLQPPKEAPDDRPV